MKIKQLFASAVVAATMSVGLTVTAANPKPFTVPEVREWKGGDGQLPVGNISGVVYSSENAADVAIQFAKDMSALLQNGVKGPLYCKKGKGGKGKVFFELTNGCKGNPEAYAIDINRDKVKISASTVDGLRWGAMTLLQLMDSDSANLPSGRITDVPKYGFRGFHLDAGRKYIPLDYLYELVDAMAYYKMNKLNLHLNDNGFKYYYDDDWDKTQAAFRLQSDTYPGLTARDGSYGKDEFREFQKYAARKGVEVIPEIDFPAHALAFTRFRPGIGSVDEEYGRDHLDLMKPETYNFLDSLLAEYLEGDDPVFVGKRFNIGTDEYSNRDSVVVEKFRYLTDRYINFAKQYGKTPLVWGSLTHAKGKQPVAVDGVEMLMWSRDYANPDEMKQLGYQMISIPDGTNYIVPAAGYYHDYLDNEYLYNNWTPADMNGVKVDPDMPQLLGGMFAVWNDHPTNGITVKDIHHRIMHSLPVIAAKTWLADKVTVPYEEFVVKAETLSDAPSISYLGEDPTQKNSTVFAMAQVQPSQNLTPRQLTYDYTVEFDLEGADEAKGTALFTSPDATFWISDPITGTMAYSREDKLYHLRHDVRSGEKNHYKIEGTKDGVRFYVDGKLVDDMNIRWLSYNGGKNKIAEVRTLVFPLAESGSFRSKLTNLQVKNYVEKK